MPEPSEDPRWRAVHDALSGHLAGMDDLTDRCAEAVVEALQERDRRNVVVQHSTYEND